MDLKDIIGSAITCLKIMDNAFDMIAMLDDDDYIENVGDKDYYRKIYELNKKKFIDLLDKVPTDDLYEELEKECYEKYRINIKATYDVYVMGNKN